MWSSFSIALLSPPSSLAPLIKLLSIVGSAFYPCEDGGYLTTLRQHVWFFLYPKSNTFLNLRNTFYSADQHTEAMKISSVNLPLLPSTSDGLHHPPLQSQRSRISLLCCTKYNNLLLSYIPLTVSSSRPLISPFICRVYAPIKHLLWPLLMTPVDTIPSLLQVDFVTDVDFCYHIVTVTVTVT